jgi:hypothetical protein
MEKSTLDLAKLQANYAMPVVHGLQERGREILKHSALLPLLQGFRRKKFVGASDSMQHRNFPVFQKQTIFGYYLVANASVLPSKCKKSANTCKRT